MNYFDVIAQYMTSYIIRVFYKHFSCPIMKISFAKIAPGT